MTSWSIQLQQLGFSKKEAKDGSERYIFSPGVSATSLWTQILVNSIDSCWQVTYSRSESQVGFWQTYLIVTNIIVNVHSSPIKLLHEIISEIDKKPGFLRRSL